MENKLTIDALRGLIGRFLFHADRKRRDVTVFRVESVTVGIYSEHTFVFLYAVCDYVTVFDHTTMYDLSECYDTVEEAYAAAGIRRAAPASAQAAPADGHAANGDRRQETDKCRRRVMSVSSLQSPVSKRVMSVSSLQSPVSKKVPPVSKKVPPVSKERRRGHADV